MQRLPEYLEPIKQEKESRQRLPEYLKKPIIDTEKTKTVRRILKTKCLNTVCEGARCPNKSECYSRNTATFLIMGNVCTRNCRYCNIGTARPEPLDLDEPKHVAEAVKELGLKYAVITSVTRDDLADGGAEHFKNCIDEIRKICDAKIEILTPDFRGRYDKLTPSLADLSQNDTQSFCSAESLGEGTKKSLDLIIKAHPEVFNHNIETVKSLFKTARPQGDYELSIRVLKYIKDNSDIITKSGLMVGLGEGVNEIEDALRDLKDAGVDIITIGQYIQPSKAHLPVAKYYTLEEFEDLRKLAQKVGFTNYQIDPLVRSSYKASLSWKDALGK